jgi:hypothetical protein
MAPPTPVSEISPDQIVTDILVSTLLRVQQSGNKEISAAAARYLSVLR